MMNIRLLMAFATGVAMLATSALAGPTAEDIAELGKSLTPIGAEMAGSADGKIPAWSGGIAEPPAGWKQGDPRPDPYAADAKLFSIDKSNVDQHASKLTDGQIYMLKNYDGYRMDIYPTHRSCGYPQAIYDATKHNASIAKVDKDGNLLDGKGGFLFPIPKTGAEVVWNHKVRYEGEAVTGRVVTAAPTEGGNYTLGVLSRMTLSSFYDPALKTYADMNGVGGEQITEIVSPPLQAGTMTLIREQLNGTRRTWRYMPSQRRVRQMPDFAYDNPITELDGLIVADQANMFNGAMDRYDWKLAGKQELYIAYNDWKLNSRDYQYKDILTPTYPNRDLLRYELHRVWKVEATLRPGGPRHLYGRRVFYSDEDSWIVTETDLYDSRGTLWRAQEGPIGEIWELPACVNQVQFHFDLNARRYVAAQLKNQEPGYDYLAGRKGEVDKSSFTPDYLRQSASR